MLISKHYFLSYLHESLGSSSTCLVFYKHMIVYQEWGLIVNGTVARCMFEYVLMCRDLTNTCHSVINGCVCHLSHYYSMINNEAKFIWRLNIEWSLVGKVHTKGKMCLDHIFLYWIVCLCWNYWLCCNSTCLNVPERVRYWPHVSNADG